VAARRKAARSKKTARKARAPKAKRATKQRATKKRATKKRATARRAKKAPAESGGSFPEVEELVQLMDAHGLLEVDYESSPDGSRRVRVSRQGVAASHVSAPAPAPAPAAAPAAAASAPSPDVASPADVADGLHAFNSPMVGTFYRAPSPETPPFANVGDQVDETSTLCIIEAMKVMNEITPDIAGEVVSVEVENGEAVEYGQTLFLIRPS
jgi:acetyl-CoA carboxylase biotin carboxyl carrier protein